MQLFAPERHEALIDDAWDASVAASAIREIVADTLAASRDGAWPAHPLDDDAPAGGSSVYLGAAGVLYGLADLASRGVIDADPRCVAWTSALPERYAAAPDTGAVVPSYLLGEAGVLLAALHAQPRPDWADRLYATIAANIDNPTLEALWGAPGTMLAAVFAFEMSAEERWRTLFRANVAALTREWRRHEGDDFELWTQDLYGKKRRLLGAGHGYAGNVFAFFRGWQLLPETERAALFERALATLRATAVVAGDLANWMPEPHAERPLVQWCHGAPGMITSFGRAPPSAELDRLLAKGGELTWLAGPLRKGPSLCHGTAGNGAAFLTLFARTGDSVWLERARSFAMHSAQQVAAARARYGQGRYGLWTGDVGVAVYLAQCLTGASGLPSLDF
jgi:hypothetical protein